MARLIGCSVAVVVVLIGMAGTGRASDPVAAQQAAVRLRTEFPQLRFHTRAQRVTRVYGRAFGSGASPEQAAEGFRLDHAELFGVMPDDLEPAGLVRNGPLTQPVMHDRETGEYKFTLVRYAQYKDGIPVFRADLRLLMRNDENFPLVLAASSLRSLGAFKPAAGEAPARTDLARIKAAAVIPDLSNFSDPQTVIWAGVDDMVVEARLAQVFIADNFGPNGNSDQKWLFVTDFHTGDILYRESRLIDVDGHVDGRSTEGIGAEQCEAEVAMPLPHLRVTSGANSTFTNTNGDFTITDDGGTVDASLDGQWFDVFNFLGAETTESVPATTPADILFNASNTSEHVRAEVNGYVHANIVRDFVLQINPSYPTFTDTNIPCWVNRTDGFCPGNAWYDPADGGSPTGYSINFCESGDGSPNTAWSSVIYHEFGHHLVQAAGSGQGQYGEGSGDVMSVLILDDNRVGLGFFGGCDAASVLRDADNTIQYPCSGAIHFCGQLLSGCVWDTRNELAITNPSNYIDILANLAVNAMLLHSGTQITPQITTDYLTLDDDNGDLSDGTPHSAEILTGFGNHNMVPPPPPANDDCADAIEACPGAPQVGSTTGASNDGSANCGDSNSTPDAWYFYTPDTSGSATFSLCSGSNYDTVLSVHSGCPGGTLNQLACDDDFCASGGPSQVTVSVTSGTTYYIRVTGWNGSVGDYTLTVTGPDCLAGPLIITFPDGLPESLAPGVSNTLTVQIEDGTEQYVPGTGTLHYRYDGGTFLTATLAPLGGDLFQATFPAPDCTDTPEFYISAQSDGPSTVFSPSDAPASFFSAPVGTVTIIVDDDFETDMGWTVSGSPGDGQWTRGVPIACGRGDPPNDSDGSGQCWLTDNSAANGCNSDVDSGTTILTSPVFDVSDGGTISYAYWLDDGPGVIDNDSLTVELATDAGGTNWTLLRTYVIPQLSWRTDSIDVGTEVSASSTIRVRFSASDLGAASLIECGVDAFRIDRFECTAAETCEDNILNQDEERIDCGGSACLPCTCTSDGQCDDTLFCTGTETCDVFGECVDGPGDPCGGGEWCYEAGGQCVTFGDGDFEPNGRVDLADFREFQVCFNQLGIGPCQPGNMTGAGAIELDDYAVFEAAITGP